LRRTHRVVDGARAEATIWQIRRLSLLAPQTSSILHGESSGEEIRVGIFEINSPKEDCRMGVGVMSDNSGVITNRRGNPKRGVGVDCPMSKSRLPRRPPSPRRRRVVLLPL